jgi:hypothetical protein
MKTLNFVLTCALLKLREFSSLTLWSPAPSSTKEGDDAVLGDAGEDEVAVRDVGDAAGETELGFSCSCVVAAVVNLRYRQCKRVRAGQSHNSTGYNQEYGDYAKYVRICE